jgi:hypothetical protein
MISSHDLYFYKALVFLMLMEWVFSMAVMSRAVGWSL